MKITIKKERGKWLVNGKKYSDLAGPEKTFFDEFIVAMRLNYEIENPNQSSSPETTAQDYVGEKL